jgi:hypothetical protein
MNIVQLTDLDEDLFTIDLLHGIHELFHELIVFLPSMITYIRSHLNYFANSILSAPSSKVQTCPRARLNRIPI